MKAECPSEILTTEGTDVKYFKNFENDNSQVSGGKKRQVFFSGVQKIINYSRSSE